MLASLGGSLESHEPLKAQNFPWPESEVWQVGNQRSEAGEELDPLLLEGPPTKHEKEHGQP